MQIVLFKIDLGLHRFEELLLSSVLKQIMELDLSLVYSDESAVRVLCFFIRERLAFTVSTICALY